ncbi:TetR/AcrR family transcriptional regulator [Gordonia sp. PP30]|uniref:ScbR family autoregulator-binding transcription factor n=1 Tax=unclassified Gordonia (in: high G+C Gram-positive bacteria) TaxID=2657482 RepID=UPI002000564C|nr:ScbR family autoregulator-binding transcription factor [Gordonia sp. PP30]UQE75387.1 TetR/AcrR family transcriptional regulator [Gordonia sp. PP30]
MGAEGELVAELKQARAIATHERILRGAASAFAVGGYDRANLNDIIAATGMTRGALYFHFKSKEELAAEVMARQHQASIAAVESIAATGAPALAQIVMLCHEMGRQIVEDPIVEGGIRLTLELSSGPGPDGPYKDWIEACRVLTVQAINEGDMLSTIVPADFAEYVISSFTGVQMVANVLTRRTDLQRRIDQMWGILLPGIMRPDSTNPRSEIQDARWTPPGEPVSEH